MRSQIYFPILRAKEGEFSALEALSEHTKALVLPLVDLPRKETPEGFERFQSTVVRSLAETWGTAHPLLLDLSRYDPDETTSQGIAYVTRLFDSARQVSLKSVPVVGPLLERYGASGDYFRSVAQIIARDNRGVAIRLPNDALGEVGRANGAIDKIEHLLSVQDDSCDLILDFGPLDKLPVSRSRIADVLDEAFLPVTRVLEQRSFRSIVFCASSIPRSLGKSADGEAVRIPNAEYRCWSRLVGSRFGRKVRFGDYAARYAHQTDKESKSSPPARINIVTPSAHVLSVGDSSSYRELASKVSSVPEFNDQCGAWGKYAVRDAGRGHRGVGNAAEWVARDTHMHIETITDAVKKRLMEEGEEVGAPGGPAFAYDQADLEF